MKKCCLILFAITFVFLICNKNTFAKWDGPREIISGIWGKADIDFGYLQEDLQDAFPRYFIISSTGKILVADIINRRFKLYNMHGKFIRNILLPVENMEDWNLTPLFFNSDIVFFLDKIYWISESGETIKKLNYPLEKTNNMIIFQNKIILEQYEPYKCIYLLPNGDIEKTFDAKPLDLGFVQEKRSGNQKYESTVAFPNHTYKVSAAIGKYSRDIFSNFYDILYTAKRFENEVQPVICYTVVRVDRCTGEEYVFEPPRSEYAGYSPEEINSPAPRREIKIEYGEPVISPLGDLYYWARTKTHYKILKWTWQGPEDAPQSLQISAGIAGLKLNWQKPVKEFETVTGYQILRSAEVCGPFTEVTTVKKDKLTFEDQTIKPPWKYYYVVKAVRDKKVSGDSNKVYMQWK